MKNNKLILVIALALFVALIAGAYLLYNGLKDKVDTNQLASQPTQDSTESTAPMAPDFTVYDANGNPVKLSDYIGKPVVLNFWASWCPPCKAEMPDFQEVYQELGSQVQFLMVNTTVSDTLADAKAFIQSSGYTFPVFYDTKDLASIAYSISSWPNTFFINAEGQIVARASGAISKATLMQGIGMITK